MWYMDKERTHQLNCWLLFPLMLQEDASVPPPAWAPNAYFRLSFTQHQGPPPTEDSMVGALLVLMVNQALSEREWVEGGCVGARGTLAVVCRATKWMAAVSTPGTLP